MHHQGQMPEKTERLLRELIAIPSVNPAFLPPNDSRGGEKNVAEFLGAQATKAGLDVGWQNVLPGRSNLIVSLKPKKALRKIVLAPHLDTVGNPEMPGSCFEPRVQNGRLHGRGACDTKGSVAAMFTALCEIAKSSQVPRETEIVFVGLVDEENGQTGSRAYASHKSDLAIVGEPTELKLVTAHKGDLWIKLICRGKAAHGSRPELGKNAVHEMAKVVDLLETKYARLLRRKKHRLLGSPTINVGAIRGGTQPNIVPDYCETEIDRRTIPGEKDPAVLKEMLQLIEEAGLHVELVNSKAQPCMPLETSSAPFIEDLLKVIGDKKPVGVDYFCDAAILGAGGTPSVVFGPGNIAQAHTADEWISIGSLEAGTAILARFLRSLP
jgi:acetylornithine deacetylase/succinyl-diaminopimelate desuccinylase-like protein